MSDLSTITDNLGDTCSNYMIKVSIYSTKHSKTNNAFAQKGIVGCLLPQGTLRRFTEAKSCEFDYFSWTWNRLGLFQTDYFEVEGQDQHFIDSA